MPPEHEEYYTVAEAAELLRIPYAKIHNLTSAKKIPIVRRRRGYYDRTYLTGETIRELLGWLSCRTAWRHTIPCGCPSCVHWRQK